MWSALGSIGVAALLPCVSFGATFAERPFPNVVYDAKGIVRGKVLGGSRSDYGYGSDGSRRIYTYYDIQVTEVLKAAPGISPNTTTLVVRELGGEKDGVGMAVSGAARFERGEDTVIFTGPQNPDGSVDVRGLSSGKYGIERDGDGNEFLTGGSLAIHGAHSDTDGGGGAQNAGGRWTLAVVREMVREQQSKPPEPEKVVSNQALSPDTGALRSGAVPAPTSNLGGTSKTAQALQSSPSVGENAQGGDSPHRSNARIKWMIGALIGGGFYWFFRRKRQ